MSEMEFHPVANIFPLLTGDEFDALVADIAENGQLEPIWTHGGQIIDGRNRYRACRELGLVPRTMEWDGDGSLVGFVMSMNLHRRHLTSSQRAVIALDILPLLEDEARERQLATLKQNVDTDSQIFDYRERSNGKASQQAAEYTGTNRQYVSDAKRLRDEAPEMLERVRSGELSIPEAKRETFGASQQVEVTIFSHKSVEYYTPPEFIEAARTVMGAIDLDPASCEEAQQNVMAREFFTKDDDGLSQRWYGRVWLNPPYSKDGGKSNQDIWSQKLIDEYQAGNVAEGVLLVKAALGYNWFENLWYEWPVCFVRNRLSFIREDGDSDGQSKMGTALLYFGEHVDQFIEVFRDFGRVILPTDGYRSLR